MKSLTCIGLLLLIVGNAWGQNVPKLYTDLEQQFNAGNYAACAKLEKDVDAFALQQTDTLVANSYYFLATAQLKLGKSTKAISFFEKEKITREKLGLQNTEDYSNVLSNLLYAYFEAGNYEASGRFVNELVANDKKLYGITNELYVQTILNAAETLLNIDQLQEAEKLLEATIKQQEKGSANYGLLLFKAGDIYSYTGQYAKATKCLEEAMVVLEKTFGDKSPEHIVSLITYGGLVMNQGKYPEAEETFDKALDLVSNEEDAYLSALNYQGLVYRSLGQYEKAEKAFDEVKSIDSASIGVSHPDYAITLSNIALVQTDKGDYVTAEKNLLEAMAVQKKNNEANTVAYARTQTNLARVYQLSGKAASAVPLLEQSAAIFKKVLGEKSPEYASALFTLGMANWKAGKGAIGIKQLKTSATIRATTLGKNHPRYAESTQKIAEYQWSLKQAKEAQQTFGEVFDNYYNQVDITFPALTEEEKAKFYYNNIRPSFDKYNSFAVQSKADLPTIMGDVYNHQINTKAVIMLATEKVKQGILSTNNPVLIKQFEEWQEVKEKIARVYSQSHQSSPLDSLIIQADRLEKELTRSSSAFASQYIKKKYTWQDVQQSLKPGEAAVEVIRFNQYNPENGGAFLKDVKYAFLVVTAQTKEQPELILLNNGNELEHKFMNFYRNSIRFQQEDPFSYKNYVEVLTDYLQKKSITKLYLSPEGVYNQINLNSIKNPFTKKYLIDEFDIHLVNNTRELAEKKVDKRVGQAPILMGFPSFNLEKQNGVAKSETRGVRGATTRGGITRGFRGGLLRYMRGEDGISILPGTQKEINEISNLFSEKPVVYMEAKAAEDIIKKVNSPRILHIATHGYFLEDEILNAEKSSAQYVPNPLLKAGLILAGAENFLLTGVPVTESGDDGILTAYEAMNLNLDNTDLVVLSACETGLGQIKNGEGVYGLQRAFRLAGAQHMVMSLWSVDDDATQELMSIFYKNLLEGKEQHDAFRAAQQKLKEKFPQPFFWGAFVMVGK